MSTKIAWYPDGKRGTRHERRLFLAPNRKVTIGRDNACEIVLNDAKVSRAHARIDVEEDRFIVNDLGSRNGTLLEKERITRAEWRPGQNVKIGSFTFELREQAARLVGEFRPGTERARTIVILLAISAVTALIALLFNIAHAIYLAMSDYNFPTVLYLPNPAYSSLPVLSQVALGISIVQGLLFIVSILAFVMWQYRAAGNLAALGRTDLSFSPPITLMWYCLPILSVLAGIVLMLLLPAWSWITIWFVIIVIWFTSAVQILRSLSELWRASIPTVSGAQWRSLSTPGVVLSWWVCAAVIPFTLGMVQGWLEQTGLPVDSYANFSAVQEQFPLGLAVTITLVSGLCMLMSLLLSIKMVNRINDNQMKAYMNASPADTHAL